jgi:hypothetical protein
MLKNSGLPASSMGEESCEDAASSGCGGMVAGAPVVSSGSRDAAGVGWGLVAVDRKLIPKKARTEPGDGRETGDGGEAGGEAGDGETGDGGYPLSLKVTPS